MHRFDAEMTNLIFEYVRERLSLDETPLDHPGDPDRIKRALDGVITPGGRSAEDILSLFANEIAPTVVSADSPRFFAFIPAAPTKASLLMDMIVSASSLQGVSWLEAAGAVAAENQALDFLAQIAGLPDSAGGTFVSGGSAGNLSALIVARDATRRERQHHGRLRIMVSEQAHSSIRSTLNIIDIDPLIVETNDGRLTGDGVRDALAADGDPQSVIGVVATAGTTNAGIIDDLQGIADVAEEFTLWFHVDAAFGGAGLVSDRVRERYRGIEHADSIVMDPHKWWFAPFDCAALIYRNPELARRVHTQDASYLDVIHGDETEFNPSDLAYHLTRRARGLALWFSLAVNGVDAYRDAVDAALEMARYTADCIKSHPKLTLLRDPELSIVLFERNGWTATDYDDWCADLIDRQIAFVTPTSWNGRVVARFAFLHPATTTDMVDEVLATLD